MSTVTSTQNGPNMLVSNYDTTKLVIKGGEFENATYTNSTGSEVILPEGTVLGRIAATNLVVPLTSAAVDGSQYPVGILQCPVTVADTESIDVSMIIGGYVDASLVVLQGADTLTTVVNGKTIGDRIKSDNLGILLWAADELSEFDNQ